MNSFELAGEQAIFTSIRTPTGEGYRIVAASAGLKPEEKQAITRQSPSHESLCTPPESAGEQTLAVAFYPLATGRLCVAFSCLAGAEHTGRGGFRVYTINVVFEREDFPHCGFNPFNIVRAMAAAKLTQPVLKPPQVLPLVKLRVSLEPAVGAEPFLPAELTTPFRARVLHLALCEQEAIVDLPRNWVSAAEAVLLGVPGKLREAMSLSAGLKFSTNRRHRLQFLHEDKDTVRSRGGTQRAEYIDVQHAEAPAVSESAWLTFVERHWGAGDFRELNRRTSRLFTSTKLNDLEDIGALYNLIDGHESLPIPRLLEVVSAQIRGRQANHNREIVDEFLAAAAASTTRRITRAVASECTEIWRPLLTLWRQSTEGAAFATPIIKKFLESWAAWDAASAAKAALDLTRNLPPGFNGSEFEPSFEIILSNLATALTGLGAGENARLQAICSTWHALRPNSAFPAPHVSQIY